MKLYDIPVSTTPNPPPQKIKIKYFLKKIKENIFIHATFMRRHIIYVHVIDWCTLHIKQF